MSSVDPTQMRVELARGHWQLGERAEAIACLERGAQAAPRHEGLLPLVDACLEDLEGAGADAFEARLLALRAKLVQALDAAESEPAAASVPAPLATPTLAKLLAEQGHARQALAVADDVLRRNPSDSRALAVRAALAPPERERAIAPPPPAARRAAPGHERKRARLERWLANAVRQKQGGRPT